jgi:hypothetical protein
MVNELIDALQGNGALLGFASTGIALAYIGSLLAFLLCVIYGLILWNKGRRIRRVRSVNRGRRVRVQSSRRGRQVQKGGRSRRRRKALG